jgi:hypothetical protein
MHGRMMLPGAGGGTRARAACACTATRRELLGAASSALLVPGLAGVQLSVAYKYKYLCDDIIACLSLPR